VILREGDMWHDGETLRVWTPARNASTPVCRWVDTGGLLRSTELEATDARIDAAAAHVAATLDRLIDRTGHYAGDPIDTGEAVDGPRTPERGGAAHGGRDGIETPSTGRHVALRRNGKV
jgi:hypothetical protein